MYGVSFEIKFIYDASKFSLTVEEIRCIFYNFPNVAVVGINIHDVCDLDKLGILVDGLKRVVLESRYARRGSDSWYELNNIDIFKKCVNIKYFEIVGGEMIDLNALARCIKLRKIDKFPKLRYLDVVGCEALKHYCH